MNTKEKSNLPVSELYGSAQELFDSWKMLTQYSKNPHRFWSKEFLWIADGLAQRFDDSKYPENQIIIPIHRNAQDMGPLLHGLSQLDFEGIGTARLTFLMHNNSGVDGTERDESWTFAELLREQGVPIDILELNDSLLTGPFASWQYALATNEAKQHVAILDADSVPPKSWFRNLLKPLDKHHDAFVSAGRRVSVQSPVLDKIITSAHTARAYAQRLAGNTYSPEFTGGQAVYCSEKMKEEVKKIFGMPDGDTLLSHILTEEHGQQAIIFANAPVLNVVTNYREIRNPDELRRKIKRGVSLLMPNKLSEKYAPKISGRELPQYQLHRIYMYCPWARGVIDTFHSATGSGQTFTTDDAVEAFAKTAETAGFDTNDHVRDFIEHDRFSCFRDTTPLTEELLFHALHYLGGRTLGPTMLDHITQKQEEFA